MRQSSLIGLLALLLGLAGCGFVAQGPPPETQICKGWWHWEETTSGGTSLGKQGVDREGLSLADCRAARHQALAEWKKLYRLEPHDAGGCECNDVPPPKRPNLEGIREAQQRVNALREAVSGIIYAHADDINDDLIIQIRSVSDLRGFSHLLERPETPRIRVAQYVLAVEEVYQETKQLERRISEMPSKPLRHVDTILGRLLDTLDRLEEREATLERQFKEYYAVKKHWFGVDEDGVLSGPFLSESAVRGGGPLRLRYVWYIYRPQEEHPYIFFENQKRCESGLSFWPGVGCAEAPTSDLESDALRRGGGVDFKQSAYKKYRLP